MKRQTADRQREFAELLVGLAGLLATHADEQEPKNPVTLAEGLDLYGGKPPSPLATADPPEQPDSRRP